jgi:hypothetical protein
MKFFSIPGLARSVGVLAAFGCAWFITGDGLAQEEEINPKEYIAMQVGSSPIIAYVCIYEKETIPGKGNKKPDSLPPSATVIRRGVITAVHRGNIRIGTKVELSQGWIIPPDDLKYSKVVVEGEILVLCSFEESLPEPENGRRVLWANYVIFDRLKGKKAAAFQEMLDTKPEEVKKPYVRE